MKYHISLLLLVLICGYSSSDAQTKTTVDSVLNIGKQSAIYSKILNENRKYWIHLPDDYSSGSKNYPVYYVLDGDINFHLIAGVSEYLGRGRLPMMERAIIIGILNTDRTRDLTPSRASDAPDLKNQKGGSYKNSGGAEKFIDFIHNELRSHIDSNYRTNQQNTFIGHSFGGLTVLYAYLNHPGYFQNYLSIDPSLWWDNGFIMNQQTQNAELNGNKKLFISSSGKMEPSSENNQYSIISFRKKLIEKQPSLHIDCKIFNDETHGTVTPNSLLTGFRFFNSRN